MQGGSDKVVFVSQLFDSDKEDDLVVFVSTPETHKQKLSKKEKNSKSHKHSFFIFTFYSFSTIRKKTTQKWKLTQTLINRKRCNRGKSIRYENISK